MPIDTSLTQTLDAWVEQRYPSTEPGAAVIVVRDGEVIYRKGQGLANLELGVPIEPDMVFRLGSITKQFTAVAILMLAEQGLLALDDPLTKFIPDYPTHDHRITVEHLLTHTSGIKSYTSMEAWLPVWRKDFSVPEMIDFFKDQPMQFAPGAQWEYCNSGYTLLGAIIEKVSGQTYEEFIQQRLFAPLGLKHSHYDRPLPVIPRRTAGYEKGPQGYTNADYLSMTQPYAAGALASTVDDLARWDAALYTDQLLKQAALAPAFVAHRLADGEATNYGYGWVIAEHAGRKLIEHGGGIHGFRTYAIRIPADRVFVAVLSNNAGIDPGQLTFEIAALVIGQPYQAPEPVALSADVLARYAGEYQGKDLGTWRLTLEDDQLWAQPEGGPRLELVPFSVNEFFIKTMSQLRLSVAGDGNGGALSLEVKGRFGKPGLAQKVDPAASEAAPVAATAPPP